MCRSRNIFIRSTFISSQEPVIKAHATSQFRRSPLQDQHLMPGQKYKIFLELEMPESEANQRIGMFTVKLDMLSKEGNVVRSSLRSGSLRYKSFVVRLFYTLLYIPMFLFGSAEEKQVVLIGLFESYEEPYMQPSTHAEVELRNEFIEVYTATLKIYADFSGLRYILYYWPLLSALVGISTNVCFICMVSVLSWIRFAPIRERQPKPPTSEADDNEDKEQSSNTEETSAAPDEGQSDVVQETASTSRTTVRRRRDLEQRDCAVLNQVLDEAEAATS
ncbi:seipin-like [Ornithodoros turicata]|uniref:seipin-like n=1 Tax=Ornithodoros turicata TaxID=34597 RepID=UPI0031389D2E